MVSQHDHRPTPTKRAVRRFIARCGSEEMARDMLELMYADASAHELTSTEKAVISLREAEKIMEHEFESKATFGIADMKISGDDLFAIGWESGPEVGSELKRIFSLVVDEDIANDHDILVAEAKKSFKTTKN